MRGLEVLLGRYPAGELKTASALAALPSPVPAGLPSQLIERRPDVVAAQNTFNAAFHLVQSAKAARLPSFALTGAGGYLTNEIYQDLKFRPWVWQMTHFNIGKQDLGPMPSGRADGDRPLTLVFAVPDRGNGTWRIRRLKLDLVIRR